MTRSSSERSPSKPGQQFPVAGLLAAASRRCRGVADAAELLAPGRCTMIHRRLLDRMGRGHARGAKGG